MKQIDKSILYAYKAMKCRESFAYFVKEFWDVIIKEQYISNWHIDYICEELQHLAYYIVNRLPKPYDLIINIPPGTTKSTLTTIMFPAWLWTQDATIRVITNSYSADLSIEHSTKSRDIIVSEKFKRMFTNVELRQDKFAKSTYENTLTGARFTTSTGGTITGKHAHIIINDDPLNPGQAASEAERKMANEHTKTLTSRKIDKKNTPVIVIMQRLHEADVTGYILSLKADKIKHICLPAELSHNVKPETLKERYINGLLDPVRLSREVLQEQKTELGSIAYSGQYEQNPTVEGGNIVKKDWFKYISYVEFHNLRTNEPIDFFADTAYTKNKENDPTGIIGVCKIKENLYVTCAKSVYANFPELIRFIKEYVKGNGYTDRSAIRVEPKASGKSVVDQLKEISTLNIRELKTKLIGESKTVRLKTVSPKIECGRIILVIENWNEEFMEQICGFPNKAHDEYVDLISYAIDHYLTQKKKPDISRLAAALHRG